MIEEDIRICDEKHFADRERIKKLEQVIPKIFETLDKYKQRPTWLVASVITFLATALGTVTVELLHHLK